MYIETSSSHVVSFRMRVVGCTKADPVILKFCLVNNATQYGTLTIQKIDEQ